MKKLKVFLLANSGDESHFGRQRVEQFFIVKRLSRVKSPTREDKPSRAVGWVVKWSANSNPADYLNTFCTKRQHELKRVCGRSSLKR